MISRRHAVVRPVDRALEIEDLGSRNGTWVNGAQIDGPTRLATGDVVGLGAILIVVESDSAATVLSPVIAAPADWTTLPGKQIVVHAPRSSYPARRRRPSCERPSEPFRRSSELLARARRRGRSTSTSRTPSVGATAVRARGTRLSGPSSRRIQASRSPSRSPSCSCAAGSGRAGLRRALRRGIGGIVGRQAGQRPEPEDADELVREELAAGGAVSVFAP